MKTRRLIALILSLILALSVCFALASCGGTEDPTPPVCESHTDADGDGVCDTEGCNEPVAPAPPSGGGEDDGEIFNEEGELILFKDGAPTFSIIQGNVGTNAEAIRDLVDAINLRTEVDVEIKGTDSEPTDVEILIGTVGTRGKDYAISKYSLGKNGYMVKQIGTKIVVLGGSDSGDTNSLAIAIKHLKEKVFGIMRAVEPYTDLAMAADTNINRVQDDYKVTSVTVDGVNLKDFTITYPSGDTSARDTAKALQSDLYDKTGIWLETTTKATDGKKVIIRTLANDGEGNGYEVFVDDDGNLVFETEFGYMLKKLATASANKLIFNKRGKVSLAKGALDTDDVRNLYYEECGATGDGETNDFEYIKLAHDLANEHGHIVHGTEGATYYIGMTNGESAIVMTDTYWHGCKFIFDDSIIESHGTSEADLPAGMTNKVPCKSSPCLDCATRNAPIFSVQSGYSSKDVTSKFNGIKLNGGWKEADNTKKIPGWDLDYLALVCITDNTRKIFIRVGVNKSNGSDQNEYILVHPDGTIDPSTPLSYDYDKITSAVAYNADPDFVKPITIDGGGALIENWDNNAGPILQNSYIAYMRNIAVYRSNVTIKNFDHRIERDNEYRGPYAGILYVRNCNNVEYRDITLEKHKARHITAKNSPGTYEIGGYGANDIRYYNVDCINFFPDGAPDDYKSFNHDLYKPGEVAYRGLMGTNFIRNFHFEGCTLTSFDAHAGLGNVTLKDCIFEHINLQGSGDCILDNVTVYIDGCLSVLRVRADYGSSWRGDVTMKNITMKYCKDYKAGNANNVLMILNSNNYDTYKDNDFDSYTDENGNKVHMDGCSNYLPVNITIDGLRLIKYTYTGYDPETDSLIGVSETEDTTTKIYLYHSSLYNSRSKDASLLLSESSMYGIGTQNRCIGSKTVTINNSSVDIVVPDNRNMMNAVYTVDNVRYVWDSSAAATEPVWVPETSGDDE